MKKTVTTLMLAAMVMTCLSCQQQKSKNECKIMGTAKGFPDGEVLYLTTDLNTGEPIDSAVVKGGKFGISGQVDSVQLALLFVKNNSQQNAPFFLEPGVVRIELNQEPGTSRVSGSGINNEWQTLNDKMQEFSKNMQEITSGIDMNKLTEAQQANLTAHLQQAEQDAVTYIVNTTEKNIGNELGFFLVTNYMDAESFSPQKRRELISKMPEAMRQRPAIKELEAAIAAAAKTEVGKMASDITLPTPDGNSMSLLAEAKKNKLTLIDFWASWCGPCRQEMPMVVELYKQYKDKGFGIVGISLDSDKTAWVKGIGELGMSWPQMSDLKGWQSEAAQLYIVKSIPQTFVIDQQGKIVARGLRGQQLADFIKKELAQ